MSEDIVLGLTIVASTALVVVGVLLIFVSALRKSHGGSAAVTTAGNQDAVFLFCDEELVDISERGQLFLDSLDHDTGAGSAAKPLDRLLAYLTPRFPEVQARIADLAQTGALTLESGDDSGLVLQAKYRKGLTHIALIEPAREGALVALDRLSLDALHSELSVLRQATRHSPILIWQKDAQDQVIWANAAYLAALQDNVDAPSELTWPLPHLFSQQTEGKARLSLETGSRAAWFSHFSRSLDGTVLHYAIPIDATVQSEVARSEILQTLGRTFASLPIGLALFDKDRKLQVFNPALVDLTGMDPLFLAGRPGLEQFLFMLRELRLLPEPKDFGAWRREIVELETAAEKGAFSEEWCLPSGRIYHVTGKPQANGAIAFFIDDITTEAAMARGFRAEIETVHHVMDALPEAIVAFNASGQSILANKEYINLWQTDPCADLNADGFEQSLDVWQAMTEPTEFWEKLRIFLADPQNAMPQATTVILRNGGPIAVMAKAFNGNGVMVSFRALTQDLTTHRAALSAQAAAIRKPDLLQSASLKQSLSEIGGMPSQTIARHDQPTRSRNVKHAGNRVRA